MQRWVKSYWTENRELVTVFISCCDGNLPHCSNKTKTRIKRRQESQMIWNTKSKGRMPINKCENKQSSSMSNFVFSKSEYYRRDKAEEQCGRFILQCLENCVQVL